MSFGPVICVYPFDEIDAAIAQGFRSLLHPVKPHGMETTGWGSGAADPWESWVEWGAAGWHAEIRCHMTRVDVDVNLRQRAVYDTYLGRNDVRRSIVLALLAAGCGSDSVLTGPDPATGIIPTVVVEQLNPSDWKTDPLDIREAVIAADALRLWVAYGGGCEPHTFAFVVSSDLIPRLESGQGPPVETDALIAHDAHGDICERLVQDTLVADLTALKQAYRAAFQAASGAVVIIFDAETHVRYEF